MTNQTLSSDFDLALRAYLEKLTAEYAIKNPTIASTHHYEAQWGQKFIRIVSIHGAPRGQSSAHSFIAKKDFTAGKSSGGKSFRQGDILLAASWAGPALNHARGNIMDLDYGKVSVYGAGYIVGPDLR
jgi:hypothetical protein